jgi:hypothetical protein
MSGPAKWSIRLFGVLVALVVLALSSIALAVLAIVPAVLSWFATTGAARVVVRSLDRHDGHGPRAIDVATGCWVGLFGGLTCALVATFLTFAAWTSASRL